MPQTESKPALQAVMDVTDVADYLKVSKRTVWRLIKRPEFPQPIRFGGRVNRWRAEDFIAYLGQGAQPH
jgi:excisionase family DNA binding protein